MPGQRPFCQRTSGTSAGAVQRAGEHEQQIRQAVQVHARERSVIAVGGGGRDQRALGAAADGARDVRERGGARAARQDEFLERREVGVEALDVGFEALDVGVGDRAVAGNRQLAAEIERDRAARR